MGVIFRTAKIAPFFVMAKEKAEKKLFRLRICFKMIDENNYSLFFSIFSAVLREQCGSIVTEKQPKRSIRIEVDYFKTDSNFRKNRILSSESK